MASIVAKKYNFQFGTSIFKSVAWMKMKGTLFET